MCWVPLGGPAAGCFAALLMAVNPLQIAYAQEARNYAMLVAATAAAHWLFVACLEAGKPRDRALYALACLVAIFTHYFAVLALAPHALICFWLMLTGMLCPPPCRADAAGPDRGGDAVPGVAARRPASGRQEWAHLQDSTVANIGGPVWERWPALAPARPQRRQPCSLRC